MVDSFHFNNVRLVLPILNNKLKSYHGYLRCRPGIGFALEIPIDSTVAKSWINLISKEITALENDIATGDITRDGAIKYLKSVYDDNSTYVPFSGKQGTYLIRPVDEIEDMDDECGMCNSNLREQKEACDVDLPNRNKIILCFKCGEALDSFGLLRRKK